MLNLISNKRYLGLFLALSSAASFMISNTFAGVSYQDGVNPLTISATRFILPAIALVILLKILKIDLVLPKRPGLICILLGVITVIYTIALLNAIELLPFAIAILIFYLFPVLTGLTLSIIGVADTTFRTAATTLIAFFGLALALGVEFTNLDGLGMIYALVAAIGLASVSVISSQLMSNHDPRKITLYICVYTTLLMAFISLANGKLALPVTFQGWTSVMISIIFYAYAMISFFIAISIIGAGDTTFYSNFEPILAVASGFLFLGQNLVMFQYIGILIVVVALFLSENKSKSN
ncbi:MAG: hypothetical protein CMM67_05465 [Rhodospirillaceae bacterium]|nr:hypothetical protein [Rhodospirillaceae bacterium]OUT79131.1 MAG: hypothetical protein CBB83_05650 [Rhodospirillaceae bacterium TMED23]